MRFQLQMLLVAAICAVLFHGAFSAPSPNVDDQPRDTADDNEETDENPILIWAAKLFVQKVGCAVAVRYAQSCGARELFVPEIRLPEEETDQGAVTCAVAKFIRKFC